MDAQQRNMGCMGGRHISGLLLADGKRVYEHRDKIHKSCVENATQILNVGRGTVGEVARWERWGGRARRACFDEEEADTILAGRGAGKAGTVISAPEWRL